MSKKKQYKKVPTQQKSTKQKKEKKPKKQRVYKKSNIRLLIWAFLFFLLLGSIQAIKSSNYAAVKIASYTKEVQQLEKKVKKLQAVQDLDIPTTDSFLKEFLTVYYTIDTDREIQLKRKERLSNYYVELSYQETRTPEVNLEVKQLENYGYEKQGNEYAATFLLVTSTVEKEPKSFQSFVRVRFKITEQGFQICSLPYQTSDTRSAYINKTKQPQHNKPNDPLQDTKARNEIQSFVSQFLTEYQANNTENLKYLMQEVEGLPKNVTVESKDFAVYQTKESPIVELTLIVCYQETGITFQEGMQLELSTTEDGKYFIKKVIHY